MATGNAPRSPSSGQLAQLATLHAATLAAITALNAIQGPGGTLAVAQASYLDAAATEKNYEAYIYGGQKPGIYDEGGPNVT